MANRLSLACAGSALLLSCAAASTALSRPALAGDASPVRWNTGAAVWTTTPQAFNTFVSRGEITDRGLEGGLNRSGWTSQQVRQGLTKPYAVDLIPLSRFLYSEAGERFLDEQTRSYVPFATLKTQAVVALRSAIMADAADGELSGAGILMALPVDFRLADISATAPLDGSQNVWPQSGCQGERQCSSWLSWAVFLPANLQAISQGNR
ncbi:MAG: alpha/beta hydrolase [Cyanobacteriota bacterium]|nr:alpha/beta hydrolase [Cyanobacteriota bacterium]